MRLPILRSDTSPARLRVPPRALGLALFVCAAALSAPAFAVTPLTTELVADGFDLPVFATAPPGDTTRLFVVEQHTGQVRIVDLASGTINPQPFLTQGNLTTGSEQGLLGLAFHPDYPDSPYVYVNFTRTNGATVIRRYELSANPDVADSTSGVNLLIVPQPQSNHNGGWIDFGPDDYLYIALGDGGGANDTGSGHDPLVGNGQSDSTRLGKILRIDVDGAFPYAIPPTNPFVAMPSPMNEFWAKGVRNPWRPGFDRGTGDFYIADVGQGDWEEINHQPAASTGGENYGWRKFEGYAVFNCPGPCDSSGLTRPIHVYDHDNDRCSMTGGYVYRGSAIPDLQGAYLFADYCSFQIWTLRVVGGVATDIVDRTLELEPPGGLGINWISSFGEDGRGEIYICDHFGGEVFRIIADPTAVGDPPSEPAGAPTRLAITSVAPNPGGAEFAIGVRLSRSGAAHLKIFDSSGRVVRSVLPRILPAGESRIVWDGRDEAGAAAAPGMYLIRLETPEGSAVRKLAVVR